MTDMKKPLKDIVTFLDNLSLRENSDFVVYRHDNHSVVAKGIIDSIIHDAYQPTREALIASYELIEMIPECKVTKCSGNMGGGTFIKIIYKRNEFEVNIFGRDDIGLYHILNNEDEVFFPLSSVDETIKVLDKCTSAYSTLDSTIIASSDSQAWHSVWEQSLNQQFMVYPSSKNHVPNRIQATYVVTSEFTTRQLQATPYYT